MENLGSYGRGFSFVGRYLSGALVVKRDTDCGGDGLMAAWREVMRVPSVLASRLYILFHVINENDVAA